MANQFDGTQIVRSYFERRRQLFARTAGKPDAITQAETFTQDIDEFNQVNAVDGLTELLVKRPKRDFIQDIPTIQESTKQPLGTLLPQMTEDGKKILRAVQQSQQQPAGTILEQQQQPFAEFFAKSGLKPTIADEIAFEKIREANKPVGVKGLEDVNRSIKESVQRINDAFDGKLDSNLLERITDLALGVVGTPISVIMSGITFSRAPAEKLGKQIGGDLGKTIAEILPFLTFPNPIAFFAAAKGSEIATESIMDVVNSTSLTDQNKGRILEAVGLGTFIFIHRGITKLNKALKAPEVRKELKSFIETEEGKIDQQVRESLRPDEGRKILTVDVKKEAIELEKIREIETPRGKRTIDAKTGKFITKPKEKPQKEKEDVTRKAQIEEAGRIPIEQKGKPVKPETKGEIKERIALREGESQKIVEAEGLTFNGIQKTLRGDFVTYTEPVSGSTRLVALEGFTKEKLLESVKKLKKDFNIEGNEAAIKRMVDEGKTNQQIAEALNISIKEVTKAKPLTTIEKLQIEAVGKKVTIPEPKVKTEVTLEQAKNTKKRLDEKATFPEGLTAREQKLLSQINKFIKQEQGKQPKEVKPTKRILTSEQQRVINDKIIKDSRDKLNIGADPIVMKALVENGAFHLENIIRSGVKKATQFGEWRKAMFKDFGQKVKPLLFRIWNSIKKEFGKKIAQIVESPLFPIKQLKIIEGEFIGKFEKADSEIIKKLNQSRKIDKAKQDKNPIQPQPTKEQPFDVVQKLRFAIRSAGRSVKETKFLYAAERSKRAGMLAKALEQAKGEQTFFDALKTQKGELEKADFESFRKKFNQKEIDELFNRVANSELRPFERLTGQVALSNLLGGKGSKIPNASQLRILEKVFGSELVKEILKRRDLWTKFKGNFLEIINIPRAILASTDLSAIFRQGLVLTVSKPRLSIPATGKSIQAFFSEKIFKELEKDIEKRPNRDLYDESGLFLSGKEGEALKLSEREEQFMSKFASRIWGIGILVKASERAFLGYLNKMRVDTFDQLTVAFKKSGFTPENSPKVYSDLAKFINMATGRGSLGKTLNSIAPLLNGVFFSPKNVAAKLQLMNPVTYIRLSKPVRIEAMKDMFIMIAAGNIVLGLAFLAGSDIELNPRSSDFGKIRLGKRTRLDIWGGFQQPIRVFAQFITKERKSILTGKIRPLDGNVFPFTTRYDLILNFIRQKFSPQMAALVDFFSGGKDIIGREFELTGEELKRRAAPLYVQDAIDAVRELGWLGVAVSIPTAFGLGLQSFEPKGKTKIPSFK